MAVFEIEQKYRVRDPKRIRKKLKTLGLRKVKSGREQNEFFDLRGILKKKKLALRLRRFEMGRAYLTLKGPRLRHRYNKRLELELPVSYSRAKTMLHAAGFRLIKKYVKRVREEFRSGSARVFLDCVPKLGWFLEIEGTSRDISRFACRLGLAKRDREERSYFKMLSGRKS